MRPAPTFFYSQMKKNFVQNNNYKTLSSERMQKKNNIRNNAWKINVSDNIYSIANL